jgi:poly-gamma-glutamate capsule biosynthesis protein CapA/YwtB (metallophosphatase superfamily)
MDTVTVMLAGDVMTGRGIDQVLQQPSAPGLFEARARDARDYLALAERVNGPIPRSVAADYPWGDALLELQRVGPQLRVVNLETSITTSDDAWPDKGIHYRMHPANVGVLTAAAIDCCVLANNHVLDWGRQGLAQTMHTLHAAGVRTAGAGVDADAAWGPAVLLLGGGRRALVFSCATASSGVVGDWAAAPQRSGIALLPDLSDATARRLADRVAQQRRGDDLVIVSIHWGANWVEQVPAPHQRFARALIDLQAADIVHGHSSHHPLPFERYRDRLILYGCGDLINDYEGIEPRGALRSDVGCLHFATLHSTTAELQRLEIVPLQLRRFRLQRADAAARHWALRCLRLDAAAASESPSSSDWLIVR